MDFSTTYKQLIEVELLHSYFLNDGTLGFLTMNAVDQKRLLKLYDILEFIDIVPSPDTVKKMAGHKLIFKKQKRGFSVYTKMAEGTTDTPFVLLPDELDLTFVLKLKDAYFGIYTQLTLGGTDIFYFGNTKPSTEGAGFKYIPKSNENTLITDAYKLSANGSKLILEALQGQYKIGAFGVINIKMIGDNTDLSFLTTQGELKSQLPVFKIHFSNRQTFWRYKKASDDTEIFTTASVNPLTKYGFIEILHNGDKFPNANANHLISENNNFFSEIYI